jgi:hypothetical protein
MFRAKHFFHANITMKQALKSRETISLERSGRFQKNIIKKNQPAIFAGFSAAPFVKARIL